jgi:uridine phosphorylase
MEYPAVADHDCTTALVAAAAELGLSTHIGITASSDTFYPGQERYDTVAEHVIRRFAGSLAEWQRLNVLNYEMEGATLFTMCAANGWRAGMVAGVLVNRNRQEIPDDAVHDRVEANAVAVAVAAARRLAT